MNESRESNVRYEVSADPSRIDVEAVWQFMSNEAYWNRWRTRADVEHQIEGAWRLVGAYASETGEMVGFARAISDGVSDAYLADMYVEPAHRGRGVSRQVLACMIDDGPGRDFRWMLVTSDAHGLYAKFGFQRPDERVMVRPPRPRA
ncbi:MAG TPA: GNAT family N-acetyltransferase [Acidimicrobiales bacterium]|jgi:GNAT superfamily N-acetyltransferase|nr:GNAT family N-acetyltransferase [Acidimicrobiales bacterium]